MQKMKEWTASETRPRNVAFLGIIKY